MAVACPDPPRIICREGKIASLLAELAIHRLDIVIADGPMPPTVDVRGFSHLLGECGLTFFASTDSDGRSLSSYCDYEIIARPLAALWWTIAVFDEDGKLIPNKAARHAFNSQSLTILPDGTQRINLGPAARPGHWLPSGEGHDLTLVLRIIRPLTVRPQGADEASANAMPIIRRIGC